LNIGVFGSSLPREGEAAYEEAREIGRLVARRNGRVVCGGYGGVMEAVCRGAREAGGSSLGVVLEGRPDTNPWVTRVSPEPSLAARLMRLLIWVAESVVKGDTRARPFVLLGDFWRPTVEKAIVEASRLAGAQALRANLSVCATPGDAVGKAFAVDSQA
jgi:hypothetical protein